MSRARYWFDIFPAQRRSELETRLAQDGPHVILLDAQGDLFPGIVPACYLYNNIKIEKKREGNAEEV